MRPGVEERVYHEERRSGVSERDTAVHHRVCRGRRSD